jgi:hypothetical protein
LYRKLLKAALAQVCALQRLVAQLRHHIFGGRLMKFGLHCIGMMLLAALCQPALCVMAWDDAPQPLPPFSAAGVEISDQVSSSDSLLAQQPTGALQYPRNLSPSTTPRSGDTQLRGQAPAPPAASIPPTTAAPPGTAAPPSATPPATPIPRPDANALALVPFANNYGMSSTPEYSLASVPHMIGDTLGIKYYFFNADSAGKRSVSLPSGDQSEKIADDTSPIPTDRVFFDYNFFSDVFITANGNQIGLNRYTFGVEKTFFDGTCSVEIKAPIDGGLNAVQDSNASPADNEGTIFGTLAITPKVLLYEEQQFAMSAGLAIGLPTAPTSELISAQPIKVFDDSVHLAPYLGFLLAPDENWFSITYLQLDFDAGGDRVTQAGVPVGNLHEPTLLYVDTSIGYWLFNSRQTQDGQRSWLTGVAPMVELHYTTTLQDAESVGGIIAPISSRVDILNLTAGLYMQIGPVSSLFVGGVAPLGNSPANREFDAEVVVQFNRQF